MSFFCTLTLEGDEHSSLIRYIKRSGHPAWGQVRAVAKSPRAGFQGTQSFGGVWGTLPGGQVIPTFPSSSPRTEGRKKDFATTLGAGNLAGRTIPRIASLSRNARTEPIIRKCNESHPLSQMQ